jgi:hypothetical protein
MFSCTTAQHSTFTVQLLYKLYSLQLNCIFSNYTQLLLHVPLHNTTQSLQLMPPAVQSSPLFHITPVSVRIHKGMSFKLTLLPKTTMSPVHSTTKHTQPFLHLELPAYMDSHIRRLDPWNSHRWMKVWCDSDKEQTADTEITGKLKIKSNICCMKWKFVWFLSTTYQPLQ